ncbi:MAG: DNA adenine methylase [Ignavibacteriaceae bacterium]|nr:DNA adenine methylase [Ignavibacteriaceae bacterium]
MKYMGSKRVMLQNGLGKLILRMAEGAERVYDPFCGSGIVSWYITENCDKPVIAGDLQEYSVVMANAVLLRENPLTDNEKQNLYNWVENAIRQESSVLSSYVRETQPDSIYTERAKSQLSEGIITRAYGGYYFSHEQAQLFDILLNSLPEGPKLRNIALAGIIEAATFCAASPGHTAQPFKPTEKGLIAINEAWRRDPLIYIKRSIEAIAPRHARRLGEARVSDAIDLLNDLKENDLVFIDPPYSAVQYSRFYHVLETIARNKPIETSGVGRYPPFEERPASDYSRISTSLKATELLLKKISEKGAKAIFTFPEGKTSNKLSGDIIKKLAEKYFDIEVFRNNTNFSTLGGDNHKRPARQRTSELYIKMIPKY